MVLQWFVALLRYLSQVLHHGRLPLDLQHLKPTAHADPLVDFQLHLRVQKQRNIANNNHSGNKNHSGCSVCLQIYESHLWCCAVPPLQLPQQAKPLVPAAALALPANAFVSSPLFLSIWPEDQIKNKTKIISIVTTISANKWDADLKAAYFFKGSVFLCFGYLSLLAFLHQRAGGVQGIMGNFILLPR